MVALKLLNQSFTDLYRLATSCTIIKQKVLIWSLRKVNMYVYTYKASTLRNFKLIHWQTRPLHASVNSRRLQENANYWVRFQRYSTIRIKAYVIYAWEIGDYCAFPLNIVMSKYGVLYQLKLRIVGILWLKYLIIRRKWSDSVHLYA